MNNKDLVTHISAIARALDATPEHVVSLLAGEIMSEGYSAAIVELGKKIHYPECWDTLSYPSLSDALFEIGCNPVGCTHAKEVKIDG